LTFYLDASVAIAALTTDEIGSAAARGWLRNNADGQIAVSAWVSTEISSALSIKVRRREINVDAQRLLLGSWHQLRDESLEIVPITSADFERASRFADRHNLNLRAGDALHVAVALTNGCTLATLDKTMAAAALECGVPVADIRP
jgi:uncharacterized protein